MVDTDSFFRLNRVQDLYEGGGWYTTVNLRSNAPYGETLHWTRPFDILLVAGALPGTIFTDFKTALYWWGVIISPVLLVATLLILIWSSRPLLSKQGPYLLGILILFQTVIISYCQPGRCDQHSLSIFLFAVLFGFGLRLVSGPASPWLCCAAGAIGGAAIWTGMDLITIVFATAAVLGLFWIFEKSDFAEKSTYYSICLFIATGISLLAERPWNDLGAQDFDRLSIAHWTMCGLLAAFWIIAGLVNRFSEVFNRRSARLIFAGGTACLMVICIFLLFPKITHSVALSFILPSFFGGQVSDVDPRVIKVWYERVSELQHMFTTGTPIAVSVQFAGTLAASAGILGYLLVKKSSQNKRGWVYVSILLLIFAALSINRIRWTGYAQLLLMFPMAEMMDRTLKRIEGQKRGIIRVLKNVCVVAGFSATFFVLGFAAALFAAGNTENQQGKKVSLLKICRYLNDDEKWQGKRLRILTNTNFGPEILYRTRHETIGSPNQRNWKGILDTYDIMEANTDDAAKELLEQRGINLILLCSDSPEFADYRKTEENKEFCQRLFSNEFPKWITKVELPAELSGSFKLFEVSKTVE